MADIKYLYEKINTQKEALKNFPGLYKISLIIPAHGVLFTWQSNTFIKILIFLNFLLHINILSSYKESLLEI